MTKKDTNVIYNLHEYGINTDTREIFLNRTMQSAADSEEEDAAGVDYRMAATFIRNLSLLESMGDNNILIHQCTNGGDWYYGLAIYDAIKKSPCNITVLAYAHARSMSSIIMQAADRRVLTENCVFLIHHGWTSLEDRTEVVQKQAARIKAEMSQMVDIYAERCQHGPFFVSGEYSISRVKTYINRKLNSEADWELTAAEAVDYGFADGILGKENFETIEEIRKFE